MLHTEEMKFEVTLEQMAFFTNAVIERDRLRREKREAEIALHRKKEALQIYQSICERSKTRKERRNDQ